MNAPFALLLRNEATARACTEILGLPDLAWQDIRIEVATDEPAVAHVTIILRADQLIALAHLAASPVSPEAYLEAKP